MRWNHRCHISVLSVVAIVAVSATRALADTPPPGDIPDNQAFVAYHGAGYSLKVPEGWTRTVKAGSVTFVDKYNAITVSLAMRAKAPTVANVTRSELVRLKASTKGFARPRLAAVSRPAGSGVVISYLAASIPSSVTGKSIADDVERYELWRAGRMAVITLEAPHGSDNVDAWKLVTSSFTWTR